MGKVGVDQVRAMPEVRFKKPAVDGKVPARNILRIDLLGDACDDPRIKATLYDFDANGMLQSITWSGSSGRAGAGAHLQRTCIDALALSFSAAAAVTVRLQADTSMGRLIMEDLPERNLLLEAYKAKK